ncbi:MAG: glycosyl transferase family 90 [Rhodobacter sp.]|nr:glycosyl transferase family 90 [Rhodobacter sp.]
MFAVGFSLCGGDHLIRLFRRNGHAAIGGLGSRIAENILYAKHSGSTPLRPWKRMTAFADLETAGRFGKPKFEAFREFRYLHLCFPEAVFILNTRDPALWLASRAAHLDGGYAAAQADHQGVHPRDLPDIWLDDWHRHLGEVTAYFAGYDRFFSFDLDRDDLDRLRRALQPWYALPRTPPDRGAENAEKAARNRSALEELRRRRPARRNSTRRDSAFEAAVTAHCVGRGTSAAGQDAPAVSSLVYAHWNGRDRVSDAKGRPLPMVNATVGGREMFLTRGDRFKLDRVQGVLNEILGLCRRLPVHVDMEDARKYGTSGTPNPPVPLLAYNRRPEARNVVLWPLPVYHSIGNPLFALPQPVDRLSFEQKADAVGWRGKLAGRAGFHDGCGARAGRSAAQILGELATSPPRDREAEIEAELQGLVRYRVLKRFADRPDFDMQLTLMGEHAKLAGHRFLAGLCGERRPPEWFFRYRYIPCLSGYDTGSNFFLAANSNSVVLKEEDGWALFYTDAFKPWEHYVPLARGASDLDEKLEWARANPALCREMVRASQQVCRRFADPDARRRILNAVLDRYAAM